MQSEPSTNTDPVFWWWDETGGSRVVLLTDNVLILSDLLSRDDVAALEEQRRAGAVEDADFGPRAQKIDVDSIETLRFVPEKHRLLLIGPDARTECTIDPPATNAGVAAGVFDVLGTRLAPGGAAAEATADSEPGEDTTMQVVAVLIAVGVVFLGLGASASEGETTGILAGVRGPINDFFVTAGLIPGAVALALGLLLLVRRSRQPRGESGADGTRVVELHVGASDAARPAAGPSHDDETPADSVVDDDTIDTADTAWDGNEDITEGGAWQPPAAASADGDISAEDTGAWESPRSDAETDTWTPADVAPDATAWDAPDADADAGAWASETQAQQTAEFWDRDSQAEEQAWWDEPVAAIAPPPWAEAVAEDMPPPAPVAELVSPPWAEPVAETSAEVVPPPWAEPVAQTSAAVPPPAPEPVAEVPPPPPIEQVEAAPVVPADVAPDSPFAEIFEREAPLPPWSSQPEPPEELVSRDALDRSIPASVTPETSDADRV